MRKLRRNAVFSFFATGGTEQHLFLPPELQHRQGQHMHVLDEHATGFRGGDGREEGVKGVSVGELGELDLSESRRRGGSWNACGTAKSNPYPCKFFNAMRVMDGPCEQCHDFSMGPDSHHSTSVHT